MSFPISFLLFLLLFKKETELPFVCFLRFKGEQEEKGERKERGEIKRNAIFMGRAMKRMGNK